jgi:membrane-associated phospholipid phosphatase
MEDRIARIITYIFHPLFMPVYALIIVLQLNVFHIYIIPGNIRWLIMGMVVVGTVALPAMLMMYRRRIIRSLRMEERSDRLYPYILMAMVYYAIYYLLNSVHIPSLICNFLLGAAVLTLLSLMINVWWKISMHMVAAGGLTGLLLAVALLYLVDLQLLIIISILISGLVGWARLKLNAHRPSEVYAGYLMGISVMILAYFIF